MGSPKSVVPLDIFNEALLLADLPEILAATQFGLDMTGVTDSTAALQAAMDVSGPHVVRLPPGTLLLTNTINITQDRVFLIGAGPQSTKINFLPATGGKAVFALGNVGSEMFQSGVSSLSMRSTNTSLQKIGIQINDCGEIVIRDVAVGPIGFWTGSTSIGIQIKGRELMSIQRIDIEADLPMDFEKNANRPTVTIDMDHVHLADTLLIASAGNPNIKIADGVNITNLTIDGFNAWIGGTHGLEYNDTTTSQVGAVAYICGVRWEQPSSAGYAIKWVSAGGFRGLRIGTIQAGAGSSNHGIYIRGTFNIIIEGYIFNGTGGTEALNIASFDQLSIINCFFNSGSIYAGDIAGSPPAATRLLATGQMSSLPAPGHASEFWVGAANTSGKSPIVSGTSRFSYTGTLAGSGGLTPISIITTTTALGMISVAFTGTGGDGGGSVALTPTNTFTAGGSSNFSAGNVASKFCVLFSGPASVNLLNNLSNTVSYVVTIDWKP